MKNILKKPMYRKITGEEMGNTEGWEKYWDISYTVPEKQAQFVFLFNIQSLNVVNALLILLVNDAADTIFLSVLY